MENPIELPGKNYEGNEMAQQEELIEFVKKNDISADELSEAYLIALGSSPEASPEKPIREEVYALAKMLDDFMSKGFTADKVGELIRLKKDYESSSLDYNTMVDKMPVSDKEKIVLKSIVNKKRPGVLTIIDAQTDNELLDLEISKDVLNKEYTENHLAAVLLPHLSKYKNQSIKITFLEA